MIVTRIKAARMLAERMNISQDRAEQLIDRHASQWQTFKAQNNLEIKTDGEARAGIAAENATEITATLSRLWASIQRTQDNMEEAIEAKETRELTDLAGALQKLQKCYLDMAEIKRQYDTNSGNMINRDAVEQIINDSFPALKKALNDLFINVKQSLKPEQRADFDIAFNKALPNYSKHIEKAVVELNDLLK